MKKLDIPNHPNPKPKEVTLDELFAVVENCKLCTLSDRCNPPEMGIGNEKARVLFLMDSPDPSHLYKPRMDMICKLAESAGMSIDEVYTTTLLKCSVPPNRQATPHEIEHCSAIFREEIRSIWPDIIVCLGSEATRFVLHSEIGVNPLHGRMYRSGRFQVVPLFHIEQLMRDSRSMQAACQTMTKLGEWLESNPK